jgi:hypothetical protein
MSFSRANISYKRLSQRKTAAARYVLVLFAVYFLVSKVSEDGSTELPQLYADVGFVALPLFAASEILLRL